MKESHSVTKKELRRMLKPGRLVRVYFEDTGAQDAMYLEQSDCDHKVFLFGGGTHRVVDDQIIKIGPYLNIPKF